MHLFRFLEEFCISDTIKPSYNFIDITSIVVPVIHSHDVIFVLNNIQEKLQTMESPCTLHPA